MDNTTRGTVSGTWTWHWQLQRNSCGCGVETVWTASSVSSVVGHFRVDGDASSSSGMEGVYALPTEGSRTTLIAFVCSVSMSVLSMALIMVL